MRIRLSDTFQKSYSKIVKNNSELKNKITQRIEIFRSNPSHNSLHSHKLQGKFDEYFSFSITGDIRIIYHWDNDEAVFFYIGKHSEVYI